ncbi:THAUMATIN-LIKE PROTEIN 1 [Hibiscus trionum]|uniref:THAUMATIN-LIKE PROTEIN 1 n=1 Tax=Hibiscus trionum TaxID=183268 RepID=A0A9W7J6Q0_HIBTR|nr:THAUMATIN-LIKE PROTEIN 1 [Hibiscus trionum]
MALFSGHRHSFITFIIVVFLQGATAATFTFINKCDYTVWPGILANPGSSKLESTGFELTKGSSRSFQAPTGWAGRFWGRTGCNFDDSARGSCTTADCGSGEIECNGAGAIPPATLAEFTLGSGSQDFYDVSLVDGYNLPMIVEGNGGSGECATTGCLTDLNKKCPSELRIDGGGACKSACDAFGNPEYCCSGAYNSPAACKPSMYSQVFKSACPKSYSYAFDDATSTFTCTGADYTITFCPNVPSLKSSKDPATAKATGSDPDPMQESALASQWLANLATGDSNGIRPFSLLRFSFVVTIFLVLSLIL